MENISKTKNIVTAGVYLKNMKTVLYYPIRTAKFAIGMINWYIQIKILITNLVRGAPCAQNGNYY